MPEATAPPDGPTPGKAIALIAVVGLFAYFNSLHGAYILDDGLIHDNPNITRPFDGGLLNRPVVAVTLTINYWLDKTNSRGYHLFNLLVHGLAAVCLWDLVRRVLKLPAFGERFHTMAGWVGLVAALVWMVHPLTTQAVTYTIQRCESLMGLFFLTTLWCFLRGALAERRAWRWYSAAAICSALGAGCKEVMMTLPAVLVLFDRAFLAGSWRGVLGRWKPVAVISLPPIAGLIAFIAAGYITGREGTVGASVSIFTPYTYALTQTEVILHYLRLTFWPVGQCLDYLDWPVPAFPEAWVSIIPIVVLLLVTLSGVLSRRTWGFPAAAFFIILSPTSSIMPIQDPAFEHRMYLPLAAIVVLVVVGSARLVLWCASRRPALEPKMTWAAGIVAVVLVFGLGLLTVVRNEVYASPLTLYEDNAAKRPENARVRALYASMLFQKGETEEAESELRAALWSPRQIPGTLGHLARLLFEKGRTEEAQAICRQTLERAPNDADVNRCYGIILLATGHAAEAAPIFQALVDKKASDAPARFHLGIAQTEAGKAGAGRQTLRDLARDDPNGLKKFAEATRTIAIDPSSAAHRLRLAVLYAKALCDSTEAPGPEALDTLAISLARTKQYPEAATAEGKAIAAAEAAGWSAYEVSLLRQRERLFRDGKPFLPASFTGSTAAGGKP